MPQRRKSIKDYILPPIAIKAAGMSVAASSFAVLLTLIGVIASCLSGLLLLPKIQPATPTPTGTMYPTSTITATDTPNAFYRNDYPAGGIQQSAVIEAVKDDMDMLESVFSWAILIALAIGWAGLIKQGDIEIIGIKVKRKYAFYLVATIYLVVNFALILLFVRLGELLLLLDNGHFSGALSKVTVHTWILNPYAFFGSSILSRGFSGFGYGLLIFCWWICYTSLYLLRDGKETTTTRTLPILFLALGIIAIVIIERNFSIISLRLSSINMDFYDSINSTKIERSILGFLGIGAGLTLFTFLVNLQSKLAKSSVSKGDKESKKDEKDDLVYPCPKCNLPYKTEAGLIAHITKWHLEQDKKN